LNKLNDNTYVIDFGISSTLNVKNLEDYKGLDFILLVNEPPYEPIFESLPFFYSKIFYLSVTLDLRCTYRNISTRYSVRS